MKALVYTAPETMVYRDAPNPTPGRGDVLVQVARVGICGSDMHGFLGHDSRRPAPLILGHEATGTIRGGPRDGERVTVNPLITAGESAACQSGRPHLCPDRQLLSMAPREGAFADAVVVPEANAVPIPDDMPFAKAALAEPLAVCWHAVKLGLRIASWPTERAVVIGGGAIGLGSALCAAAHGAPMPVIVEPNDLRRGYLRDTLGLEAVRAEDLAATPEIDMVFDSVGYGATRALASQIVRPGGVIVHIGLGDAAGGLDIRRMTLQEIACVGSYCYTPTDFRETVEAMTAGRLGSLEWTETRPLDAGGAAFADIRSGRVPTPKILLAPEPA